MSMPVITDIHLSTDGRGTPIIFPGQKPAGAEHQELMDQLVAAVVENPTRKKVNLADGSRWRVQRMREGRYALRRMRDCCPGINDLGLPQWVKAQLLGSKMRETGGLIVICGLTGAGKTTTFSATISARLQLHAGYCLTIEDPPEDLLEGSHGEGYCEQIDADEVGGYETAIHAALRCFPAKDSSMLGYGEVRDPNTAAQLLRVAVDGHLVLMTMHSKTIPAGLQRLAALARAAGEENANELIATSIQLAVHQRFDLEGKLVTTALPRDTKMIAHIRQGEFAALTQEVERAQQSNY
ncbi:ATPase, T2SS/T4P/T4SS family [Pseudomonas monteilii]|uniref:ATPase, T2SS/T4P/T4SS family n=1 Tax=Pseudomonas monteilii TaxID=76759 RepID=UPI0015FB9D24|nr:ATPase, T2SS/T4P/T4SS family [Pseudomonas monteilii]MBA6105279.1 Flp pilus assembly complex ATPase component TadA [Pseudomonas monteilii]